MKKGNKNDHSRIIFTLIILSLAILSFFIIRPFIISLLLAGIIAYVHPLVMLFGTVGGLAFFGLTGIILGPVLFALFFMCVDIYRSEYLKGNINGNKKKETAAVGDGK